MIWEDGKENILWEDGEEWREEDCDDHTLRQPHLYVGYWHVAGDPTLALSPLGYATAVFLPWVLLLSSYFGLFVGFPKTDPAHLICHASYNFLIPMHGLVPKCNLLV